MVIIVSILHFTGWWWVYYNNSMPSRNTDQTAEIKCRTGRRGLLCRLYYGTSTCDTKRVSGFPYFINFPRNGKRNSILHIALSCACRPYNTIGVVPISFSHI